MDHLHRTVIHTGMNKRNNNNPCRSTISMSADQLKDPEKGEEQGNQEQPPTQNQTNKPRPKNCPSVVTIASTTPIDEFQLQKDTSGFKEREIGSFEDIEENTLDERRREEEKRDQERVNPNRHD